jgi:hypothetical protein
MRVPFRQSVVDGRHQLFVVQHLVGVGHPILAKVFHLVMDQSVAEAELGAPHFNHRAFSLTLLAFEVVLSGRNRS